MNKLFSLIAVTLAASVTAAAAQPKSGGTLRMYHRDNPPTASIHEEATVSTVNPFMAVFNNLVLFDQGKPRNSLDVIVPDLAESWAWSADKKTITFKLRHDNSQQVAEYYLREMSQRAYVLKLDEAVTFPVPGAKPGQILRNAPGRQLVFAHPKKQEAVMLWAIEQPIRDAKTQVALGFGPLSQLVGERATHAK